MKKISDIMRAKVDHYLADHSEAQRWQRCLRALDKARELRNAIREERGGKLIDLNLVDELNKIRRQLGCCILWSEDLNDDQEYGDLRVLNPFTAGED